MYSFHPRAGPAVHVPGDQALGSPLQLEAPPASSPSPAPAAAGTATVPRQQKGDFGPWWDALQQEASGWAPASSSGTGTGCRPEPERQPSSVPQLQLPPPAPPRAAATGGGEVEALPLQYHLEHHHSAAGARLDCAQVLHRTVHAFSIRFYDMYRATLSFHAHVSLCPAAYAKYCFDGFCVAAPPSLVQPLYTHTHMPWCVSMPAQATTLTR